ncbi:hydroxyphenylacetyl-CoA thioesterase PaaI [Acinetobacter indicus]|uniref:hydroxyphenylacetyl-CoA thioesterase PaaI n=1 Tax=Acinetobacter indicus TaxID=756892 RepID=UPI000CEC118B|nr:hydroxyphenylacetyl-CoA thioesterase PaaI [Acinetobacter indicus]
MDQQVNPMFHQDRLMQHLRAHLVSFGEHSAQIELKITEQHLQGHQTCNGAVIFALADAAFAIACNTGEHPAVGQHCGIHYLKPGLLGDTLTAVAEHKASSGRSGIYDIRVTNQKQQIVAEFRGTSRLIIK